MAKDETEQESTDGEKPKRGLKKIIMIVVPVLALAGGGYFFFLGGGGEAEAAPSTTLAVVEGEVIQADTLTVNLVGEEGRYAKVGFAMVLVQGANQTLVAGKLPLVRDAALSIMTGFGSAELQTQEGMDRLRGEMTDAAVELFPDGEVIRIVLTELIVQ
jgi:flagellar FliL protein